MTGGLVKMFEVVMGADLLPAAGRVSLRNTWVCGGLCTAGSLGNRESRCRGLSERGGSV